MAAAAKTKSASPSQVDQRISSVVTLQSFRDRVQNVLSDEQFIFELVSLIHAEKSYVNKRGENITCRDTQTSLRALELLGRINGAFTVENSGAAAAAFNVTIKLSEPNKSNSLQNVIDAKSGGLQNVN